MTCMDWLRNFMNGQGPMPCKYVTRSAKAADFTRKDLRAARTRLGGQNHGREGPGYRRDLLVLGATEGGMKNRDGNSH